MFNLSYTQIMQVLPLALQSPDTPYPIRPVRLSDVDSLHHDCWPERPFSTIYNLINRAIQNAEDRRGIGLVVEGENGRALGYGQYVIWPTCAEISDLIVADSYRSQGLGTAIIQTLVRAAVRAGVEEAEIGAAVSNPRAAALYRRLGFQDSHLLLLNLGNGKEEVMFLRLPLRPVSA